jgi:Spy/CpxP family protein refolding chaperone
MEQPTIARRGLHLAWCAMFAALTCVSILSARIVGAQPPAGRGAGEPGVSPAELQKMFDAYALMQAQEQLKISDDQYPQFLRRFKALQDVRRKSLAQRTRTIVELRRLANDARADDAQLRDHLKTLDEIDARSAVEIRNAFDEVNQLLDARQQAKFRVFEEAMERRKLELISRARQANRVKKQE